MAETTALAFAVISLFNDSVDIFQYIQIGKNFDRDTTTYALLLMQVQLTFSRWGEGVGLKDLNIELDPNLSGLAFTPSPEMLPVLKETLEQIMGLLKESQEKARKKTHNTLNTPDAVDCADVNAITRALRKVSLARRNIKKFTKRQFHQVGWAIHGRDDFRRLLDDLKDLVSWLQEHFPLPDERKVALVKQEILKLNLKANDLVALQTFLQEDSRMEDDLFKEAIDEAVAKQGGTNTYNTAHFTGAHNMGQQIGHGGTGGTFTNNVTAADAKNGTDANAK